MRIQILLNEFLIFQKYATRYENYSWITSVPGAMMAIAARGFILWFINLAILIFFVSHIIDWYKICVPVSIGYKPQYLDHADRN